MTRSILAPTLIELMGIGLAVGLYTFAEPIFGDKSAETINLVGPLLLTASLGFGIWQMASINSASILTPVFTFRVATSIYFGLGSLIPMFVSDERLIYIQSLYMFSAEDLAKLNLLVALSVLTILAVFWLLEFRRQTPTFSFGSIGTELIRVRNYGLLFASIGSAIKYLFILPSELGFFPEVLPNAFVTLSSMSLMGIFLLTLWSLSGAKSWLPAIAAFVCVEMLVGVIIMSKTVALLPLVSFVLGFLVQRASLLRLALAALVLVAALEWMQPLVGFGRDQLWLRTGGAGVATLNDRLEMLEQYYSPAGNRREQEFGASAMRITYVNAATLALNLYDNGRQGQSFEGWYYTLIPRIVWPDKPQFQPGKEFALLATMHEAENSVSPGMFAEAYWNFGWWGIICVMPIIAIFFVMMSRYVLMVMTKQQWLYIPIAFICTQVGLSIDGMFVGTVLGSAITVFGFHILALAANDLMRRLGIDVASSRTADIHRQVRHSLSSVPRG